MCEVGEYCFERYRYVQNVYGEIIKVGTAIEGTIKSIVEHQISGDLLAELETESKSKYVRLKWLTSDILLKNEPISFERTKELTINKDLYL